jgi:hypothetical protein
MLFAGRLVARFPGMPLGIVFSVPVAHFVVDCCGFLVRGYCLVVPVFFL